MSLLHVCIGVSEDSLAIPDFELGLFRSGEAVIQHHLVVFHEIHFSLVFFTEVILTLTVLVTFLCKRGSVALIFLSKPVCSLIVLAQVVVECALAMSWCVLHTQATRRVGDVSVTTTAIVHVYDGFGMDAGQIVRRTLLKVVESA